MSWFRDFLTFLGILNKKVRVVVLGLNNSGKSTVMNKLKPDSARLKEITPTVGFSVEKFSHKRLNFTCYDMSGHNSYRNLWAFHYKESDGIIFVVDCEDRFRMSVVKNELDIVLEHPDIVRRRIPILFLANKMDMPEALSPPEVVEMLGLQNIMNKRWSIVATCATTGEGLEQGMSWLGEQLKQ
eukprot:gnl/Hemi2/3262_TR1146_c0_g1_i1.p1 gnl/Hemi2/3262_TR1146_c0_g1~~gnl/Hemi2/3262_TR1146_c0_g1_i1.p1  ORF type:complete len:184 (+),score=40.03 gnl/Hemi2/3262_TR1146_c0_g1_i1:199-750(+)